MSSSPHVPDSDPMKDSIQAARNLVKKHLSPKPGVNRSRYWLLWAGLAAMVALTAITGNAGSVAGGLVGATLCGAYAYYLYNGGRFIIVPVWLMVILMIAPFALIFNLVSPNGSSQPVSRLLDMKCTDYNKLSSKEQYKVTEKIYASLYTKDSAVYNHAMAINNIGYRCMTAPYGKLRYNI